jgi:hypothetical protein
MTRARARRPFRPERQGFFGFGALATSEDAHHAGICDYQRHRGCEWRQAPR